MAAIALVGNMIASGGGPASGCKLTSCIRSTSTPSPLYSDVGLATPTTNPYVGDADGRLDFYFSSLIQYTWTVRTADNAQIIWQADVVGGVVSVTYTDAALIHTTWAPPLATALGSGWAAAFALPAAGVLDNLNGIRFVSTYAALTALTEATGLADNAIYCTYARATEEDGGFGFWRYDATSTATANGGTILAINGGGAGRFFRAHDTGSVSAGWWGAIPDYVAIFNGTDLGPAVNSAIAYLQTVGGGTVTIPDGNYRCATTIVDDRSSSASVGKVSIKGSSSNAVTIYSELGGGSVTADGISGGSTLFSFIGNQSDPPSYRNISGLTLFSYAGAGLLGTCFRGRLGAFGIWRDLVIQGFGQVADLEDFDHQTWENVRWQFNRFGPKAYKNAAPTAASTQPNQWCFYGCTMASAAYYTLRMTGCGQPIFSGGSSEGNNTAGTANGAIEIINPAFEGGIALAAYDFHCERNKGADWFLKQDYDSSGDASQATDAIWYFSGCDFARASNADATTNAIRVSWEPEAKIGRQIVSLNGCVFKRFLAYVPDVSRPYIAFVGTQQASPRNIYVAPDCYFDDTVETPAWVNYGSQPFIELTRSGDQSVSDVTETVWSAAQEVVKWGEFVHSAGWVTIPYAGLYEVDGFLQFTSLPSGQKIGRIKRDVGGLGSSIVQVGIGDVTGGLDAVQACGNIRLGVGDKVAVSLYHSTGGAMNIAGSGSQSRFNLRKISG